MGTYRPLQLLVAEIRGYFRGKGVTKLLIDERHDSVLVNRFTVCTT